MIKASNPVVKDGLGIAARLVVIAMLLSVLSTLLQGCTESRSNAEVLNGATVEMQVKEVAAVAETERTFVLESL